MPKGVSERFTDRGGESLQMKKRTVRLTEDENEMLEELLKHTGVTLRDLIAEMIEERWMEEINNG